MGVNKKHMKRRGNLVLLLSCLLGLLIDVNGAAGMTGTELFTGRASDEQGNLSYVERHRITYRDGRVIRSETTYFDADNRQIGDLLSEYQWPPQHCTYSFRDSRASYEDGVKVEGDRLVLHRQKTSERESAQIPKHSDQIVGQGFHHFLVLNLDAIAKGEVFHVKLVMPSRLDQFSFRIRKLTMEGDILYIRLEIDNWFLRLFAPHVDCEYDLRTRRLLRYVGVSNLEDPSGAHRKVNIIYTY